MRRVLLESGKSFDDIGNAIMSRPETDPSTMLRAGLAIPSFEDCFASLAMINRLIRGLGSKTSLLNQLNPGMLVHHGLDPGQYPCWPIPSDRDLV